MFKKIILNGFQSLAATLVLFLILESVFFLAGFPRGATRFIETAVIRQKLDSHKPKGEFRIQMYGESTMHGSHYWPVSNVPRWLEAYLQDFLPNKSIKIINFARMGQGAAFIYDSFHDTVDYKPDLAVFYLGHNTFLPGNRKWEVKKRQAKFQNRLENLAQNSRFISAVYRWIIQINFARKRIPEDRIEHGQIETSLGAAIGPENAILRTDPRQLENLLFYKEQIIKILELAKKKNIPVILFRPVSNLKDFSPFGSAHIKKLSSAELAEWETAYEKGKQAQARQDQDAALGFYTQAYKIDPTYAELSFRLGQIRFLKGDLEEARRLFIEARDNDTIVVRATSETLQILGELQAKYHFPLIETEKIFVSQVPGGILGEPVIEDNVHFSIKGHSLLAHTLAEEIYKQGWIAPKEEWHFDRARSFEEISKVLGVTPDLLFSADVKMVHYFGSRTDNRIRFAQKALEIRPEDPTALRQLAWTYWWIQNRPEALKIYQKLNRVSPEAMKEVFENQPEIKKEFEGSLTGGR